MNRALCALGGLCSPLVLAAAAAAATPPQAARPPLSALGSVVQLPGRSGCLVDRSRPARGCTRVRALRGPAPFLGSNAVAISPDGRNVYVAAATSNAIAVFSRDARTGALSQRSGTAGCLAADGSDGCAKALALRHPNSVAISADGRSVYATSFTGDAVAVLRRAPRTGALTQARDGTGCIAASPAPGCTTGRALDGPDVVIVSPDGHNVYVGSFAGSALAVFARRASTGTLTQPAGVTGCIVDTPAEGCTTGLALAAPEGMAISGDGDNVYVAAAASNALGVFTRDAASGALTQATDGTGCIAAAPFAGCTTGTQLGGANAVAISPGDGEVYVTSLLSNSLTTFTRSAATGQLAQQAGTSACVLYVLAVGCSLGRAFSGPEGLAVSADGASVYAAAFASSALDVLDRNASSGSLMQKPRRAGCVTLRPTPDCSPGRALRGVSSIAVSPDGRHVYAAANGSDAISSFKRVTRAMTRGQG